MEGDGPLVFSAYEEISTLYFKSITPKINVKAIADKLAGGVASHTVIKSMCAASIIIMTTSIWEDLEVAVSAFKCARFFSPAKEEVTFNLQASHFHSDH